MSKTQQVIDWIASQPEHVLRTTTISDIARAVNMKGERVSSLMYQLEKSGRITFRREATEGKRARIVGIESLNRAQPYGRRNKAVATNGADRTPERFQTRVPTPNLDGYNASLRKWEQMKADPRIGQYLDETPPFMNPIAEEANFLREALIQRDERYAELSQDYAMAKRELDTMRNERRAPLMQAVHAQIADAQPEA
jgi:hypothetical protein